MIDVETPEETAARWRQENAARGAMDTRNARNTDPAIMDRYTAASIRAQRHAASALGGTSTEHLGKEYDGDVLISLEVVTSAWGVWWSDSWENKPDATIVLCYDRDGEICLGQTTIGEVRRAPVAWDAPTPRPLVRIRNLREPWNELTIRTGHRSGAGKA